MVKLKHVPRWITASIHVHFLERREGIEIFLKGMDVFPEERKDIYELRIDGPYAYQVNRSDWQFFIEVNLSFTSLRDEKDHHKVQRVLGSGLNMFSRCIPVFKFGDGPDDDNGYRVGDLLRSEDQRNPIRATSLGQIQPDLNVNQGTIDAFYRMDLEILDA